MDKLDKIQSQLAQIFIQQLYDKISKAWNYEIQQKQIEILEKDLINRIQYAAKKQNGRAYIKGYNVQKNQQLAKFWYKRAYELGEVYSIYNLYKQEKLQPLKIKLLQQGIQKNQLRSIYQFVKQTLIGKDNKNQYFKQKQKAYKLLKYLLNIKFVRAYWLCWIIYCRKESEFYNKQRAFENLQLFFQKSNKNQQMRQLKKAYQLVYQSYFQQSIVILSQIYKNYPKIVQQEKGKVEFNIGQCQRKLGNLQSAKEWFEKSKQKKYLKAFYFLAMILHKQNQQSLQDQLLHKAILLENDKDNYHCRIYSRLSKKQQIYKFIYQAAQLGDEQYQVVCLYLQYKFCQQLLKQEDFILAKLMKFSEKGNKSAKIYLQMINHQRFHRVLLGKRKRN